MKICPVIFCIILSLYSFSQNAKTDIAKNPSSPERKEILEALKKKVQPDLKLLPKLVVEHLYMKGNFAFFQGNVKDQNGKEIDFAKTVYKEADEEGAFDGDATTALLKKTGGKWKVLAYSIGATDVPYVCWWKEFKAPKEIFSYAENNCD